MLDGFLSAGVFGQSALLSCLFSFFIQLLCLIPAYQKKNQTSIFVIARAGAIFQFMMMSVGMLALIAGYVINDFSIKNVFENSHTETPLIYRITGAWGNHEGSMLLWLWLMSLFGLLIGNRSWSYLNQNEGASLHIFLSLRQGIYQVLFLITLLYVFFLSNPFQALNGMVSQGLELNPILQDPALAIHPPTLYTGYVGFGVVYAMALAGAISGVQSRVWLKDLQRWTLVSWTFLTLGIALGSWWAYYELGWGGWWFWDPVENASLMPWLSATALLHLVIRARQSGEHLKSTYFLGVLTYSLCLLGTFLVRSGSLSSVHAFAQDPGRGLAIFSFTCAVIIFAFVGFYVLRTKTKQITDEGVIHFFSLRGVFSLQNLLFMALLITVVLGTTYPLFVEAISGKSLSVGAPYFHKTFVPICFGVFILMGVAIYFPRTGKRISGRDLWRLLERPVLLTVLWMIAWGTFVSPFSMVGLLGSSASFWIFYTSFHSFLKNKSTSLRKYAVFCSHVGVAIMVFGMTADYSFRQENTVALALGEKIKFNDYEIILVDVERVREHTFMGERGLVEVYQDKKRIASLHPEKRFYPSHQVLTTETALYPHGFSNLYVALGGILPGDKWTLRLYHHPFVLCIWIGAVLMALGGGLAFASYLKLKKIRFRIGKLIDV